MNREPFEIKATFKRTEFKTEGILGKVFRYSVISFPIDPIMQKCLI